MKRRASLAHFGGAAGGAEEGWGREWRGFSGVKGESEGAGRRASAPTKPNGEVREVKVKDRERAGVSLYPPFSCVSERERERGTENGD